MDYEKLRETFLEFISKKPYVPTYEREKLTDQLLDLIKAQPEPKAPKEDKEEIERCVEEDDSLEEKD